MCMTLNFKDFLEREEQANDYISLTADELNQMSPAEIKSYFDKNRKPFNRRAHMKLHMQLKGLEQESIWRKARERRIRGENAHSSQINTAPDVTQQL